MTVADKTAGMPPLDVESAPSLGDLEVRVEDIFDRAQELEGSMESDAGIAKMLEIQLKAVRLRAELREKNQRPKQMNDLMKAIEKVERQISAHHAGSNHRSRTPTHREGEPPPWRQ